MKLMGKFFSNSVVDIIASEMPVVGTIMRTLSDQRLEKRLQENKEKIEKVVNMVPVHEREYFLGKVGRTVFERIEADDEDDKVEYLLLGFENCVKRELHDAGEVLFYFDILSSIRMNDLRVLHDFSEDSEAVNKKDYKVQLAITNLLSKGLIRTDGEKWGYTDGDLEVYVNDFKLTMVGKQFLEFIKS